MKKIFWLLGVIFTFGLSLLISRKERSFFSNLIAKEQKSAEKCFNSLRDNTQRALHNFKSRKIRTYSVENDTYLTSNLSYRRKLSYGILGLAAFSFLASDILSPYSSLFKASLLTDLPKTEFIGTVSPVEKVPNWSILSSAEYQAIYSKIPQSKFIELPKYDTFMMRAGKNWSKATDQERNTYVSYPVPNLGNYKLDGTENTGSHPGVDLKLPHGTPIRSIANGVIYKTQNKSTGFGKAVSIAHVDVPDPENPRKNVTLVSTYAHLSTFSVQEGQIVKKGQIIAKSGNTGMSTSPHLHFQIDRSDAPFIPYWPFDYNDVKKAGFSSFFDAVKNGVGQQRAKDYTVHPINFVAKFEDFSSGSLVALSQEHPHNSAEKLTTYRALSAREQAQKQAKINQAPLPTDPNKIKLANDLAAEQAQKSVEKAEQAAKLARQQQAPMPVNPNSIELTKHEELIVTTQTDPVIPAAEKSINLGSQLIKAEQAVASQKSINPSTEADNQYYQEISKSGKLQVQFLSDSQNFVPGREKVIKVKINESMLVASSGILISSTINDRADIFPSRLRAQDFEDGVATVRVKTESPYRFKMIASGDFGESKSNTLRPTIFTDVDENHPYADAISYLKDINIINGYQDGSFKPDNSLNRAETLKIILMANNVAIKDVPVTLSDITPGAWYRKYVGTAISRGIVKGYGDKTFKPANTISRAEFLKIAILTAGFKPQNPAENPYKDIVANAWYAPYFEFAKQKYLLDTTNKNALPAQEITRAEAANIIYKLSRLRR